MSAIAQSARVSLTLCDYAQVDSAGKVNILGAGWQVTAIDPQTGATAPHSVVVSIDVAPDFYGDEFAMEAALYGPTGDLAEVPSPTGTAPLRIGQNVVANKPMVPGQALPNKVLWAHSQLVLNFPGGLAIAAGSAYTWRVRIDNDDSREWAATFFVAGPPQGPVIG